MPGHEVIGAEEQAAVNRIFSQGGGVLFRLGFEGQRGHSYQVRDFEHEFADSIGASNSLAVSSGTAALRVALASLGIGIGDEVITQSFTFVATVEAIIESGARPVCAEVDENLDIDLDSIESLITPKTRAVIAVHMLGYPADLVKLRELCDFHNLFLVEDVAWGCGASFKDKALGLYGDIATFSFDHAKALTTGEGGMIVCKSDEVAARARAWHDHGHENNPDLPRWLDSRSSSGFNFRMSELQGAVGRAQLAKLARVVGGQVECARQLSEIVAEVDFCESKPFSMSSQPSFDALILRFSGPREVAVFKKALQQEGVPNKILPDALTWHFAGFWHHMAELSDGFESFGTSSFPQSYQNLSKCIAIPTTSNDPRNLVDKFQSSISGFHELISAVDGQGV